MRKGVRSSSALVNNGHRRFKQSASGISAARLETSAFIRVCQASHADHLILVCLCAMIRWPRTDEPGSRAAGSMKDELHSGDIIK